MVGGILGVSANHFKAQLCTSLALHLDEGRDGNAVPCFKTSQICSGSSLGEIFSRLFSFTLPHRNQVPKCDNMMKNLTQENSARLNEGYLQQQSH